MPISNVYQNNWLCTVWDRNIETNSPICYQKKNQKEKNKIS